MLKRSIICTFTIICLCFMSSMVSFGQVATPTKSSNKLQNQTTSLQKQAKIINDAAQSSAVMAPLSSALKTKKGPEEQAKYHESKSSADWWLVVLNGLLVIVVFLQWRWMNRQVIWMQKSADVAEKDLIFSHRAFVFLKKFDIQTLHYPKKITIIPTWQNSGNTQTKKMFTRINWKYFSPDIPDNYDFADLGVDENIPTLIAPKSTIDAHELIIEEEYINAVINKDGQIYIYGWAEYNDIFENTQRHRTEFCYRVVIIQFDEKPVRIYFEIYAKYNGTDNECLKEPIN